MKKLSTGNIVLISIAVALIVIVLGTIFWIMGTYNSLVRADETVNEKWANVQTAYQRRADLIPNLVAVVKQYSNYEGTVLKEITDARAAVGSAKTPSELQSAGAQMDSALSRLLVVVENYPNLKANENYISLQDELAGTENRINVERQRYNTAVSDYNKRVRMFPSNIISGMFGFYQRTFFEAAAGAENAPPVVF